MDGSMDEVKSPFVVGGEGASQAREEHARSEDLELEKERCIQGTE